MSFSLVDISNCGGHLAAVHFALFFMSVAAVSIVLERLWYFRRSGALAVVIRAGRRASDEGLGRAARRRAMERAVREERHLLGQGLRGLLTVGLVAPLVGLLGSVTVLMSLFRGMALTRTGASSFSPTAPPRPSSPSPGRSLSPHSRSLPMGS